MLSEIYCDEFHQKQIIFNTGLSVVLGTKTGDNSIGKSTFLLIVDYVFGGSTYAKAANVIEQVGSHDIYFSFVFGEETFKFCRNNIDSQTVWKCDSSYKKVEKIELDDYCAWLDSKYAISLPELSFRDAVGRYIRVYGKNNYDDNIHCIICPLKKRKRPVLHFLNCLMFMRLSKKRNLRHKARMLN